MLRSISLPFTYLLPILFASIIFYSIFNTKEISINFQLTGICSHLLTLGSSFCNLFCTGFVTITIFSHFPVLCPSGLYNACLLRFYTKVKYVYGTTLIQKKYYRKSAAMIFTRPLVTVFCLALRLLSLSLLAHDLRVMIRIFILLYLKPCTKISSF